MTAKQFYEGQTSGGTNDVLHGKIKDLADIVRLLEAHPDLWHELPDTVKTQIQKPAAH